MSAFQIQVPSHSFCYFCLPFWNANKRLTLWHPQAAMSGWKDEGPCQGLQSKRLRPDMGHHASPGMVVSGFLFHEKHRAQPHSVTYMALFTLAWNNPRWTGRVVPKYHETHVHLSFLTLPTVHGGGLLSAEPVSMQTFRNFSPTPKSTGKLDSSPCFL